MRAVHAPRDIDFVALRALQTKHGVIFPPDHVIFQEGDRGYEFYVILDGEVEMLVGRPDGRREVVAVLRRGDFFGEMAVFRRQCRAATARTRTRTSLLYFGERTASDLLVDSPRFAIGIIRALCDRVGALDHEVVTLRHALDAHRAFEAAHGLKFAPPHSPLVANAAAAALPDVLTDRDIHRLTESFIGRVKLDSAADETLDAGSGSDMAAGT